MAMEEIGQPIEPTVEGWYLVMDDADGPTVAPVVLKLLGTGVDKPEVEDSSIPEIYYYALYWSGTAWEN